MADVPQKKITKTQARYLARATQNTAARSRAHVGVSVSDEVMSVAPLLESAEMATGIESGITIAQEGVDVADEAQKKSEDAAVHIIETTAPTPVPIRKGSHPKRNRSLIEGEPTSSFMQSFKKERSELIDVLCAAGFNHNRFALGNDGYAEEVKHEVRTALTVGEWSVGSILERKEYGFRSWKDIAEEVAQVSVIQKDVLTDALFDAIVRAVTLYPSAGTKEMMRSALIHTLVFRTIPEDTSEGLKQFLREVTRVYFTPHKNSPFSPFEHALIGAVYAYYGDSAPSTVSHEVVHSGGWTGLKQTLIKGTGATAIDQSAHSPKSETYPLPDIALLPKSYN